MDKQILNFTVNEQILTVDEPIRISTNKVNYIEAHFDLGTNWSGYDSIRAVWFNDFNCISTVLDSLGNCAVPFEVMKRKGCVKVNLVGSISEDDVLTDRLTSYPVVAVIVDCTAQITGANTSPITPSEFEQFAQRVHTDANRAETAASNAETSAQNAHTSEQNASQSAQSARDDKITIEQAIAEVIQQIEDFEQVQVVVNTLPPTSPATSDFTDGVLTLGIPQGVKGDTGNGIQGITKTGTSGLVDTYTITFTDGQTTTFNVTNGAKGDTGNGISSIEKTSTVGLVDTYTITYTNGTTTTFTVANGEKGDKGDTGEVSLSELEDATIVQTLSDSEPYNYRRTNNGNGSGTREYDEIVGASVGWCQLVDITGGTQTDRGITATLGSDGVIALSGTSTTGYAAIFDSFYAYEGHVYIAIYNVVANPNNIATIKVRAFNINWPTIDVCKASNSQNTSCGIGGFTAGTDFTGVKLKANIIDLTLFNSQIADYVYSLEQSTAGSGVTWLKTHFPKLFDNGYQPFDSGSIKSVSGLTAHAMCDANDNIIGNYPLDSSVTLRGQYRLDANNNLYADGDVWKSDGEITRKYGTRAYQSGDESDATVVTDGTTTVYPLTTPTTESAPTYDNPQWCDVHGTEEYVGSELPVGHNTDYPMTMVDCADGLGDGTYTPKLTVTNGKLTFEWQSV